MLIGILRWTLCTAAVIAPAAGGQASRRPPVPVDAGVVSADRVATKAQKVHMRSPEEIKLDFLVGQWTSSDQTFAGPAGPGGTSQGNASYAWELGGKWLNYQFRTELPGLGPYEVQGGVAYEQETGKYRAYASNNLGNLLIYEGSWETDQKLVFTLVYPQPQADTRVSYTKGSSGTVRLTSERPRKGGGREIYFETVLSRPDSGDAD